MSKDSKVISVVSVIIVLIVVVLLTVFIGKSIFGGENKNKTPQISNDKTVVAGNTKESPINLSDADLSLTGGEFAEKYNGKYVSFDGLLQGTSTVSGASNAHTGLIIGDDINKGTLADGSVFWITAGSSTFSDDLASFATNNSTPYESKNYPKVHIIAKVDKFSESYSAVQLDPITNIDGKTPSVTSR
jgi:hypothetical protein